MLKLFPNTRNNRSLRAVIFRGHVLVAGSEGTATGGPLHLTKPKGWPVQGWMVFWWTNSAYYIHLQNIR